MFERNFYKGKKVLVTGHTGFKGTWLLGILEQLGCQVYGYSLPLEKENNFYQELYSKIERSEYGLIQESQKVEKFVREIAPEIVIHLASHSTLDHEMKISQYVFETNVMGVVNLLEAVRNVNSVKAVLIVTSDKCYENQESGEKYNELSKLGAQDPYSTSKACQELVTECYRRTFFSDEKNRVRIATARASNVIGGGDDNLSRLFPYLLDCFSSQKVATIRKRNAIRPWQNVLDVLGGYLTLIQKLYEGSDDSVCSAFNFGPEDDGFVSVGEVAEKLKTEFAGAQFACTQLDDSVIETNILKLDNSKAKENLGWRPMYSFDETVKMVIEFEKRKKQEEIRDIVMDLTGRYLDMIERKFIRKNK